MVLKSANSIPTLERAAHEDIMRLALTLAQQGRYTCDPNPMVGAIIALKGTVIGRGYHAVAGSAHAEVNAIADALKQVDDLTDAELYVTLEPCSHTGRTPPCCAAIEQHQFKTIIVACLDPNPKIAGQGLQRLSKNYSLVTGILENEAQALNQGFFHRMHTGLPWVQVKMGASLDGKIALRNGTSQWITGQAARQDVHHLRLSASAVLTGRGTLIQDNARLDARAEHLGFQPTRQPLRVILDQRLESYTTLQQQAPFQPTLVITASDTVLSAAQEKTIATLANLEVIALPTHEGLIQLPELLKQLGQREINSVLIEAGPTLAGQFIQQGLANEITLYFAPLLLGPQAQSLFNLPLLEHLPNQRDWHFHSVNLIGTRQQQDLRVKLRRTQESPCKAHQ